MYKYVLFDLDGTLTDSKEGILNSVAYALEKMGISSEGRLDPHVIVGPPLLDTFEDYYGFEPEKARQAYSFFQERYSTIGKFENRAFEGIVPLLKKLREKGIRSFVATSKPQVHAEAICEKFGLAPYLEAIAGPAVGGTDTKADVMKRILKGIGSFEKGKPSWSATVNSTSSAPMNWDFPSFTPFMATVIRPNERNTARTTSPKP